MKIVERIDLASGKPLNKSSHWKTVNQEIETAIDRIVWPLHKRTFTIYGVRGKNSRDEEENGVKPIKDICMSTLKVFGWSVDDRKNLYQLDALRNEPGRLPFGLEWETGNISSSHRAINRLLLGHFDKKLEGGGLIVPSSDLYLYLTDRIGNIGELRPYVPIWQQYIDQFWADGVFRIYVVEQDAVSSEVPRIGKGKDGMAQLKQSRK